jgi:hypothetical protein
MARAMFAGQTDWQAAVEGYSEFLETNLLPDEERAELVRQIEFFTAELVKAQASGDREWIAEVTATLSQLQLRLRSGGLAAGTAFGEGLSDAQYLVALHAQMLANTASKYLIGRSPPPLGPLSRIDEGGENVGRAWAEGLGRGVDFAGLMGRLAVGTGPAGPGMNGPLGPATVNVTVVYSPTLSTASEAELEQLRRVVTDAAMDGFSRRGLIQRPPLPNY